MAHPHTAPAGDTERPNAVPAVVAGVLVLLTGLWHLFGLILAVVDIVDDPSDADMISGLGLNALIASVSVAASITILARKPAGRIVCAVACALAIAMYLFRAFREDAGVATGSEAAALTIVGIPAAAALVLALLPSTRRWLAWGRPVVPPPSYQPRTRYPSRGRRS